MKLEFINNKLFASLATGLTLAEGKYLYVDVPKQYSDQEEYQRLRTGSDAIVVACQSAFWMTVVVTLLISISLKSVWIFLNMMQVVAYVRLYSNWPANTQAFLDQLQLAISMDAFYDRLFDFGEDQYDLGAGYAEHPELVKAGVRHPHLYRNMGIYTLVLGLLLTLSFLYCICKLAALCCPKVKKLESKLRKILHFSAWIRFMIEIYLKLAHNLIVYIVIMGSFGKDEAGIETYLLLLISMLLALWPIMIAICVRKKRYQLVETKFAAKFNSMYLNNKTNHPITACYHTIFCIRRLLLIAIFMVTRFSPKRYIIIMYLFVIVQSAYFLYISVYTPHIDGIDNFIEILNEGCLILLAYVALIIVNNFADPEIEWILGYV